MRIIGRPEPVTVTENGAASFRSVGVRLMGGDSCAGALRAKQSDPSSNRIPKFIFAFIRLRTKQVPQSRKTVRLGVAGWWAACRRADDRLRERALTSCRRRRWQVEW